MTITVISDQFTGVAFAALSVTAWAPGFNCTARRYCSGWLLYRVEMIR
jgi:hypothetical protein